MTSPSFALLIIQGVQTQACLNIFFSYTLTNPDQTYVIIFSSSNVHTVISHDI